MKISWWDRNVKIRYKFLVVIDEFLTVTLLTCLTGEGCNVHHLISSPFRPSACQLSAVVPFRLPVLRSGTVYQMTSPRSVPVNLPAPSEDILIPLLLQHWLILPVLTLAIVVLVVALLLRPLLKMLVIMMMTMMILTCWLMPSVTDWMSIVSAGVVTTSFFLLLQMHTVDHSVFLMWPPWISFLQRTKWRKHYWTNILATVSNGLSLVSQFTEPSLPQQGDFVHKHFTKRCSDI